MNNRLDQRVSIIPRCLMETYANPRMHLLLMQTLSWMYLILI